MDLPYDIWCLILEKLNLRDISDMGSVSKLHHDATLEILPGKKQVQGDQIKIMEEAIDNLDWFDWNTEISSEITLSPIYMRHDVTRAGEYGIIFISRKGPIPYDRIITEYYSRDGFSWYTYEFDHSPRSLPILGPSLTSPNKTAARLWWFLDDNYFDIRKYLNREDEP